ncbi:MAG: hypothetical protein LBV41_00540 [Cytophagaceae bacterium]|nr:hypothetical protein [Cytophagaceae bacterium]
MRKKNYAFVGCTFFLIGIVLFASCVPKISTQLIKHYSPIDYREEVAVLNTNDDLPKCYEKIGKVKIRDTGFSTDCEWDAVIDKAKFEARKNGGNVLKVVQYQPPTNSGSCPRIEALILKVDDTATLIAKAEKTTIHPEADYALLHIYRLGGTGFLVNYDLLLNDEMIWRTGSNKKTTVKVFKEGVGTLRATTEAKREISVNIVFGKEYYIRCGIATGIMIGRPRLEIVDATLGRMEFELIKTK